MNFFKSQCETHLDLKHLERLLENYLNIYNKRSDQFRCSFFGVVVVDGRFFILIEHVFMLILLYH